MNARIGSIVATVTLTLLTLTSGGCGMRQFFFGRGAQCGTCGYPAAPQPNYNTAPRGPYQPASPQAGCGCQNYSGVAANQCGTCGQIYSSALPGTCGCNGEYVLDPYQSGTLLPMDGQIIDNEVTGSGTRDNFGPADR
ncbi:MAG: hypothetical protein MI861_27210 [Pirellulales bacterium]|nr:hypothetical protein [Pirellulales bacterium]